MRVNAGRPLLLTLLLLLLLTLLLALLLLLLLLLTQVSAIDTCLREPQGRAKCATVQAPFDE